MSRKSSVLDRPGKSEFRMPAPDTNVAPFDALRPPQTWLASDLMEVRYARPIPLDTGFLLTGYGDATTVCVAGSFNNWDKRIHEMKRRGDTWYIAIRLTPGSYEYKFVVDGKWIADPENPAKVSDELGNINSVRNVNME